MADAPNHQVILTRLDSASLFSELRAGFDAKGNLVVSGQDIGRVVEDHFGRDEYEYWITVPPGAITPLAQALGEVTNEIPPVSEEGRAPFVTANLKRLFSEVDLPIHFTMSSQFRTWLDQKKIQNSFYAWP